MIKRTLDISDGPTYLFIENDQLVLLREKQEIGRVPCEDIGMLLVDNRATTYSHSAMTRLLHHGAVVVLCDESHLPAGLLMPVAGNELLTQRLRAQTECSQPLRKQLWRQVVREKIAGQARNLPDDHPAKEKLHNLRETVHSGDTGNCEGQAARLYFPALFGEDFRRDRDGLPPNGVLNYGYMVMRAAVARAICAAGLHPALGLNHHNRNNAFCLADDLVEVLRPRVDAVVLELMKQGGGFVDKPAKTALLGLLTTEITVADQSGPLMVGLHRMVASLVRCYEGTQKELDLPQ
jgi:CRISP-associated protein Cas1